MDDDTGVLMNKRSRKVEVRGVAMGGLFGITGVTATEEEAAAYSSIQRDVDEELWHKRLGHLGSGYLKQMRHIVQGMDLAGGLGVRQNFPGCVQGKHAERPHPPKETARSPVPLGLVHIDVCGPLRTTS